MADKQYFPEYIVGYFGHFCHGCELHNVVLKPHKDGYLVYCSHYSQCKRVQEMNDASYKRETYLDKAPEWPRHLTRKEVSDGKYD